MIIWDDTARWCPQEGWLDASHDRARLRSAGTPVASPLPLQSGTAILAVTATGHRLEACATFRSVEHAGRRCALRLAQTDWIASLRPP